MKIIVSIKQVPDTSGKVAVNPDGTLNRASMQTITNPDDMNALEAALKIKDATGCRIYELPATPDKVKAALAAKQNGQELKPAKYYLGPDMEDVLDDIAGRPM